MSKWREVRLGEIVTFKTGRLNSNQAKEQGKYPFYTCSQEIFKTDTYAFDTECIILGGNNAEAKYPIFYKEGKFNAYQRNYVIEPKTNDTNIRFMFYALFLRLEHMRKVSTGATTKFLTLRILNSLKVKIPDLKTQEKIGNLLSTYDELIENNNRRIEILEKASEEIYKEWFVRMRFPGYKNAKFIKGIPEGWEVKKIGDIILYDIGGGWGKERQEGDYVHKAYVIRGTDIPEMKYGRFNYKLLRFHKESNLNARRLKYGDIIFEVSGGSFSQRLGRTFYITDDILKMYGDDVICASFCKLIRTEKFFLSWFLRNYFNYAYEKEILSTFEVQSTGISNFGFTAFKKLHSILLPEEELIKSFFNLTYNFYNQAVGLWQQNQNLIKQRDLLLPRLMNGTIEIN